MSKISKVYAREILDSRSTPTIEAVVILDDGNYGVASIPSGASTGSHEALELRDKDPERYMGNGVLTAVNNVNDEISKKIIGMEAKSIEEIDKIMIDLDGTKNKSRLGANAILGVSIAYAKVIAASEKKPLYRYIAEYCQNDQVLFCPIPLFNMINGGRHGAGNLDFQEFFVIPTHLRKFSQMLESGSTIYGHLKKLLARRGAIHSVGDEGGFAPNLFTNLDAFAILNEAITAAGHRPGIDIELGLDLAANSFHKDGKYVIKDRSSPMEAGELIDYLRDLNNQYHLRILEDPIYEDDWNSWKQLTTELGSIVTIVGDDLLVTSPDRTAKAISEKACNSILIKPNQIGTVSEAIQVIRVARAAGWKVVVSHRSGETNDTFISDFAVGVGADYVKFGAPARGERVAKYNRLLAIESEMTLHSL